MAYLNDIIAGAYKHVAERLGAFRVIVSDEAGAAIKSWGTNDLDDYTTTDVTYIGQEDLTGAWRVIKINETGSFPVYSYASESNNSSYTTYEDAWAQRTTMVYNNYSDSF